MPRIPMFKMGKLRPRKIKCLAQGRVPGRWWSWDLEPRRVTAEGWSGTDCPVQWAPRYPQFLTVPGRRHLGKLVKNTDSQSCLAPWLRISETGP